MLKDIKKICIFIPLFLYVYPDGVSSVISVLEGAGGHQTNLENAGEREEVL